MQSEDYEGTIDALKFQLRKIYNTHDEYKKYLDAELAVKDAIITKSSTEKSMKHGMACSVCDSAASVSLATFAKVC